MTGSKYLQNSRSCGTYQNCVRHLPEMASGCTMGRLQRCCWIDGCYLDMQHVPKHCYRTSTSLHGNSIPSSCYTAKNTQQWFEEHDLKEHELKVLLLSPNSPDVKLIEPLWDVLEKRVHGGPTLKHTGLKGSAANILVPDNRGHFRGLWSPCPNGSEQFGGTKETYTI